MKKKLFTFFSLLLLFGLQAAGEQRIENRIPKANAEDMVTVTYSSNEGGQVGIRYNMTLLPNGNQVEKGSTITILIRTNEGFEIQ
ncbi:MAG: hypothetical protein LBG15_13040, partial [Dysgonamonadaceae bacterium]|nr:hypothetical protein [Dysgonamonadaceae bacterium]